MVHKDFSERQKSKPRGRPFAKGNKRGKLENDILASSGHQSGDEGGIVDPSPQSSIVEPENESGGIHLKLPEQGIKTLEKILKDNMNSTQPESDKAIDEDSKALELIDKLEFKNGENTLTIRFSKKHNRMFRIQVFLNEECEIRPVTYTGASTGYSFWNLLKGNLKK